MGFDAIIIGAGPGGLSAGAHLAKAGRKVLVLEKGARLGGRCRSVELIGRRFDIGAFYLGGSIIRTLDTFGKSAALDPVMLKAVFSHPSGDISYPPGFKTLGELSRLGVPAASAAKILYRTVRKMKFSAYRQFSNLTELNRFLSYDTTVGEFMSYGALISAADPDNLPAYWLNLTLGGAFGCNRPFYPRAGSRRVPELLAEAVKEHGGGIVYNSVPSRIVTDGGRVRGVELDGRLIESDIVISSTGIKHTVEALAGREQFPEEYLKRLGYLREGFAYALMFVALKQGARAVKAAPVHMRFPSNLQSAFRSLKDGRYPDEPMYAAFCPEAATAPGSEAPSFTVRFPVPKGEAAGREAVLAEADRVLRDLDSVMPGFSEDILDRKVFAPADYANEFGLPPVFTTVADSVHYEKLSFATPMAGLYCVGSSVLPNGGCAASAVESGRICVDALLKKS